MVMTVLSSARRHGLNEWEYLVDVLYRLSDWGALDSMSDLLPDRWQKSSIPPTEATALVTVRMPKNSGCPRTKTPLPLSAKK
jgi:hypothetical protein